MSEALILLAVAPFVGFLLKKLKEYALPIWTFLTGFIIKRVPVQNELAGYVLQYLQQHGKEVRFTSKVYTWMTVFVRPLNKTQRVVMRKDDILSSYYLYNKRPIWHRGVGVERDTSVVYEFPNTFSFIRGTIDFEDLLKKAADAYNEEYCLVDNDRHCIHIMVGRRKGSAQEQVVSDFGKEHDWYFQNGMPINWSTDDLGHPIGERPMERLSLNSNMTKLYKEIKFWFKSKLWFEERGIPWKRGYLLHGPPGSGKTSVIRAIAQDLDMPIYLLDLASMNNQDLQEAWNKISNNVPAVALIEDIDGVFQGRENVAKTTDGVSFDCLLNCLDGIQSSSGILVFITTNKLNYIDPALYEPPSLNKDEVIQNMPSRPGRIDRVIEVDGLDHAGKMKLAMRIVQDQELAKKLVEDGAKDTPAQLQERCCRFIINGFFDNI